MFLSFETLELLLYTLATLVRLKMASYSLIHDNLLMLFN